MNKIDKSLLIFCSGFGHGKKGPYTGEVRAGKENEEDPEEYQYILGLSNHWVQKEEISIERSARG